MAADSGAIGGNASHEFQVIADTGEDAIVYCPDSDYAANMEMAEALAPAAGARAPTEPLVKTPTPGKGTCEDVAALLRLAAGAHRQVAWCWRPTGPTRGDSSRAQIWLCWSAATTS